MPQATIISSTSNPRIQRARRLKRKSDRDATGAFLVESVLTLEAAVHAGLEVRETFVANARHEAISRCEGLGLDVTLVSDHVLRALADATTPQNVVAVVSTPSASLDRLPSDATLVLVLAELRDPGNAGTLVRSAAAAGADAVIFTSESVDPYGPKTVRSSAGALFAMPVIPDVPFDVVLSVLRDRGFTVYLAEAGGEGPLLSDADLTGTVALVVGNEAHGIPRRPNLEGAGFLRIPMPGGTESLNVAVAGSILLYETIRQRRGTGG